MIFYEELSRAPQLVAYAWHHNGLPYDETTPKISVSTKETGGRKNKELLSELRAVRITDEDVTLGGPYINWDVLAKAVADLVPGLDAKERIIFQSVFVEFWRLVESSKRLNSGPRSMIDGVVNFTEQHSFFMKNLNAVVLRKVPVGSCARRRIKRGESVSYPSVLKHMHQFAPGTYGDYKEFLSSRDFQVAPILTHRQLSLHAEFAPLLAAIFISSRMPRALINGSHVKDSTMRPLTGQLLDTLLRRRPDNLGDDFLLSCVRWLAKPREAILPEPNARILG